jgi:hypothetical protein
MKERKLIDGSIDQEMKGNSFQRLLSLSPELTTHKFLVCKRHLNNCFRKYKCFFTNR